MARQPMKVICDHPERKHYVRGNCRSCHERWYRRQDPERTRVWRRNGRLRHRYDITPNQYDELVARCGGGV